VGDDLADIECLRNVGYPIAVANAVSQVKNKCIHVTEQKGGFGATRELFETILYETATIHPSI